MLSIIVVDYKSIEKTVNYIFNLIEKIKSREALCFVVVDNDEVSHDAYLRNRFYFQKTIMINDRKIYCYRAGEHTVSYYHTGNNLGYAKGNNQGCAIAKELFGSEYYLISNNDLEFPEVLDWEAIKHIFKSDSRIGIVGPKIVGIDGAQQSPHKKPTVFGSMFLYYWSMATKNRFIKYSDIDYDSTSKFCYRVMGCFWFIKAKMFWACDGFDEGTFLYAEELILAEKFLKNNFLTYFDNDHWVVHRHGETLKNTANMLRGFTWSYESNRYYFKKYRSCPETLLKLSDVNFKLFYWLYTKMH